MILNIDRILFCRKYLSRLFFQPSKWQETQCFESQNLYKSILTKGWPSVTILSVNLAHCHYCIWLKIFGWKKFFDTFFWILASWLLLGTAISIVWSSAGTGEPPKHALTNHYGRFIKILSKKYVREISILVTYK